MVGIKQVVAIKLKGSIKVDKYIVQINELLREYQDRNGELVYIWAYSATAHAVIQYDA